LQGLFSALATINSFPGERMLALRERAAGTYYGESPLLRLCHVQIEHHVCLP
jgi:hypothetical protein